SDVSCRLLFVQAEDGIRDFHVTGVQTCALPISQRRRILTVLKDREQTVGAISERLGLAQPATSKHLKVLKEVGLVDVDTRGRHRSEERRVGKESRMRWTQRHTEQQHTRKETD